MVIFYIYHRTNNYGHTNLGALMLKYDRIMRYKQRHIIIRATPHDQSKCRSYDSKEQAGWPSVHAGSQIPLRTRWEDTNRRPLL